MPIPTMERLKAFAQNNTQAQPEQPQVQPEQPQVQPEQPQVQPEKPKIYKPGLKLTQNQTTPVPEQEPVQVQIPKQEPVQTQIQVPTISKPGAKNTASVTGPTASATELYRNLASNQPNVLKLGATGVPVKDLERQLDDMYASTVSPLYESYLKASEAYKAGTGTQEAEQAARRAYEDAMKLYNPMFDTYEMLSSTGGLTGFATDELSTVESSLGKWASAIDTATLSVKKLNADFAQAQADYSAREAAYLDAVKQFEADVKVFNASKKPTKEQYNDLISRSTQLDTELQELQEQFSSLNKMQGKLQSESAVLDQMQWMYQDGFDTYRQRYLEAHPQYVWAENEGGVYDENGELVKISSTFDELYDHVQELKSRASWQSGADRERTYDEIRYYYGLMNTGLSFANMTQDEIQASEQFFQDKISTAEEELAGLTWVLDAENAWQQGLGYDVPEGRDYGTDRARYDELRNQIADAQSWYRKLESSEYENVYSNVISGLSKDTQKLIDAYILQLSDPETAMFNTLTGDNNMYTPLLADQGMVMDMAAAFNMGFNGAGWTGEGDTGKGKLLERLKSEGLSDQEATAILQYLQYEANAVRMDKLAQNLTEDASEAGTISNFITQLTLGLQSGAGAIDLTTQKALNWLGESTDKDYARMGRSDLQTGVVDPFLGKVAPLDYNSFNNLSTVGTAAIGQGEYLHLLNREKQLAGENASESELQEAEKWAQRWYNVYNIVQSIGQSTLIAGLYGAGFKQSLLLLSGSAASQTMQDMHDQGFSDSAVIVGGLMSGFAEYITEEVSLENLLSTFKRANLAGGLTKTQIAQSLGLNVLSQVLAEGSEEGASDLLNLLYDQTIGQLLNGGVSQIEMAALRAQQENPGLKWEDALSGAWQDWGKQLKDDMIAGAISGGLMGAGGYAWGYARGALGARGLGTQTQAMGNEYALAQDAAKAAETIEGKAAGLKANNGTHSKLQAGRLLNGLANTNYLKMINARLESLGETDITPELLRAINDAAAGDHLLPDERAALAKSKYGSQAVSELKAFNDAMLQAEETGAPIDLSDIEMWTLEAQGAKEGTIAQYTQSANPGVTAQGERLNTLEQRFRDAQAAHPNATVMTAIAEELQNAGETAPVAVAQGELLGKIFDGKPLTKTEVRLLDLNNPAVRKVFVARSGLTGIPNGNITNGLKATYVDMVTRDSALLKQRTTDISNGLKTLSDAQQQKAEETARELRDAANSAKKPWFQQHAEKFGLGKKRAENARQRQTETAERTAAALTFADRSRAINVEGRTEADVVRQVRMQTGLPNILPRSLFIQAAKQSLGVEGELTAQQQAAIDTMYNEHLQNMGLTKAEITALNSATSQTGNANISTSIKAGTVALEAGTVLETDVQKAAAEVLQQLAKRLGLKIYLYETTEVRPGVWQYITPEGQVITDNGWYDARDGSIHLDINAGSDGRGVILFTAAHELTHWLKDKNIAGFEKLKKFLIERYDLNSKNNPDAMSYEQLVQAQIEKAAQQGRTISREVAEEEVVADSMERMLADGRAMEYLEEMRQEDKSWFEKIVDFLRDLFTKLRDFYADTDPDSVEGRMVAEMTDAFDDLQKLWAEGLSGAAELQSEAEARLDKMAPKDIDGDPGTPQFSSMRSYAQGAGFELRMNEDGKPEIYDRNGKRVKEVTANMVVDSPLGKLVQDAVRLQGLSTEDAQKQYQFIADLTNMVIQYRDAAIVWEVAGSNMFSAIKANSDKQYSRTIDFSTICKKTQQIINVMSDAMVSLGHGLTRTDVEAAYEEINKAGEQVPCPVCYVFSHWMGIGNILDDINRFQNKYWPASEESLQELMVRVEQEAIQYAKNEVKRSPKKADTYLWDKDGVQDGVLHKKGDVKIGRAISDYKQKLGRDKMLAAQNTLNAIIDNKLRLMEMEHPERTTENLSPELAAQIAKGNEAAAARLRLKILEAVLPSREFKKISATTPTAADLKKYDSRIEAKLRELEQDIDKYKQQLEPFEAYQFLNGTIMLQAADGSWSKNENYNDGNGPIPPEILYDLNAGHTFAAKYPDAWAYRTTRGANAGKAMLPYSDTRVGEIITGIGDGLDKIENLDLTLNPFLFEDDAQDQAKREELLQKAIEEQRRQNLIGGMRYQSTSDFRHQFGSDYLMSFFEMQAIGANVQLYTKVIEAVDFLASMGADCNLSVMPLNDGFEVDVNGNLKLVFSSTTGMNGEAAIEASHRYDNVQPILVGISDAHIRAAIRGRDITFVIPFHGSGNTTAQIQTLMAAVNETLNIGVDGEDEVTYDESRARDYTNTQSDKHLPDEKKTPEQKAMWKLRMDIIQGKAIPTSRKVKGKTVSIDYFTFEEAFDKLSPAQQELLNKSEILRDLFERFYVRGVDSRVHYCFLASEQAKQIFPYEYWDRNSTYTMETLPEELRQRYRKYLDPNTEYDMADVNGFRFQEYCESMGIIPRFSGVEIKKTGVVYGNFTKDTGYWKLLIDRKMFKNRYNAKGEWVGFGEYRDQQKINVTDFEAETLDPKWAESNYGDVMVPDTDTSKTAELAQKVISRVRETEALRHSGRDFSGVTQGLNFRDPTGELLDRVFDGTKKYETRRYTVSRGNGKLAGAFLNKPMGIVHTGAGPAQLEGFWELGDGQLKGYDWLKEHAVELGNDGTEFEAKPGEKRWVYPIKWAERVEPEPVATVGQVVRDISDITSQYATREDEGVSVEEIADPEATSEVFDSWGFGDDQVMHSRRVTDPDTLRFLNDQVERGEVLHTYKTYLEVVDDDGTVRLYAPMAVMQKNEKGRKQMSNALTVGEWEESVGNPNSKNIKRAKYDDGPHKGEYKINPTTGNYVWVYTLTKEKEMDSNVDAAYNPYQHSSNVVLNDQFEAAYKRPRLVTYECVIPKSELTSGYHYQAVREDGLTLEAKDPVGEHEWHKGVIAGNLKNTDRRVYMTRWLMPVRRLDNAEVARMYKEILDKESQQVPVPFNVVPPGLQLELERLGVPIDYEGTGGYAYYRGKYGAEKYPIGHRILGTEEEALYAETKHSSRSIKNAEQAAELIDEHLGKGAAENLKRYVRTLEQRAVAAEQAEKLAEAQRKLEQKQFKKELAAANRVAGDLSRAHSKVLRVVNNEHNKTLRENQRKIAQLEKKMADMSTDAMWREKIAQSQGEQKLKAIQRLNRQRTADLNNDLATERRRVREAERAGMALALEAEREGQRRVREAERAGMALALEAEREGQRRVREAERAGMALAMEEHREGERKATKAQRFGTGLARSREQNARAEERRIAKGKLEQQRKVLSLPGSSAVKARSKFNSKAKAVMINEGSAVCTPIDLPGEPRGTIPEEAAKFARKARDAYSTFYRAMVNDVAEIDRMAKLQTRTDNMSVLINVLRASRATPEVFYKIGMVDKEGNLIGPAFEKLLLCYDTDGKFSPEMQKSLQDYMFHKHNVDRMSLEKRAVDRVMAWLQQPNHSWLSTLTNSELAQLAAEGNDIVDEYIELMQWANNVKNKAVMPDADNYAVTAEASQAVVDTYEKEMPWLIDKANEIYKYWDLFMRNWAVGASISLEEYEEMREMYPHYVPTYRKDNVSHGEGPRTSGTTLSTGQVVKGATGSLRELENLEDQFVKSMQSVIKNVRENDLVQALCMELFNDDEGRYADFGVFDYEGMDQAFKSALWDFDEEQNKSRIEKLTLDGKEVYKVSCWVDGVRMGAYVNRAMFEGFRAAFGQQNETLKKIGQVGNKVTSKMKEFITGYNPAFAVKNFIRDQHTALTNSNVGIAYLKYLGRAAAKMAQNDTDWINFQALGGVSSNETKVEGGFAKAMADRNVVRRVKNQAKEKVGALGDASESVSRFAEYLATLDLLGGNTYENRLAAIRGAAEITVDFGRAGYIGRVINQWVPYWNANVQGLDKAIRNIFDQPDVRSILKRSSRAVLVNLIPAALQAAIIGALGRWKDYEELSDQQKDNYYCIPIPNMEHKFIKIPKSQDWAAFISTPFIRFREGVHGRDDPFEGWFESAVVPQMPFDTRTVLGIKNVPVLMPIGLDWALELAENKNWAGSAIIPYNLVDASSKEQFDADTSVLAYYFGKLFKGSPMALDYIINDYLGNFYGTLAHAIPGSPLSPIGYYTGESKFSDKRIDAIATITSPFLVDNRYSNSTMAAYYEMINQLEQEVTDAGAHGDEKDAEHYDLYKALTQAGGYVDQIRALTGSAREMVRGNEQAEIKWEAVGLADMAMEFVQRCLDGEIEDPKLWMTYAPYGETILHEAEALKKYEDEFNYDGQLGKPKVFYNRTGDVDIKYNLEANPEWQREYVALRTEAYRTTLNTIINSSEYQRDTASGKAARLEAAKRSALKDAETQMIQYLNGVKAAGETIGKTDYSSEQRAAAYSVSWLMGETNAYKPEITDQLVDLYDYHDQYSFIPTDSAKKTFADPSAREPGEARMVYVLDKAQQKKYAQVYHDEITDAYTKVMATPEYKAASPELRAAMLAKAKTYANESITDKFYSWLQQTGATATTKDVASPDISLEAKYAVQRAMGDDHAMKREVTDELVRLYQYSDVGEVEFFPIATAPKQYVDDRNKKYMWELDETQREVYMSMMFDIYQKNILKVMGSHQYQIADDRGKAQLLCDVRSRLSGEVQAEFKHWLRTSGAPRTYRKSDEIKAQEAEIAAAQKIVDQLLGKARSYKDFNRQRHY